MTPIVVVFTIYKKCIGSKLFVLFDLILYVSSTLFQLNRNGSSRVEMCLAQGPQRSDAGEARTHDLSVVLDLNMQNIGYTALLKHLRSV